MNKEDWKNIMSMTNKAIWFLALVLLGVLILNLWETTHPDIRCGFDCSDCSKNITQGAIKVPFLMDKLKDINEIRAFCLSKGYAINQGIQSGDNPY